MAVGDRSGSASIGEPRVRVDGVHKRFDGEVGSVRALADVSFDVYPGEFVCLVGPSGSGKTTLFRLIAGLEAPTSGAVLLDGEPVEGPGPRTGVVFQEYHLFPWLTVRENVGFGPSHRSEPPGARRRSVDELLDMVGLAEFAGAYPKELSGGMKQRVGIARALAVEPDLLLMDEPFGAVDAQTREELQAEVLELHREFATTILFVTHDVDEAVTLADRIVVIGGEPGHVRETIDVDLERPRDRSDGDFASYHRRVREAIRE